MTTGRLAGKNALVTGGTRGIGRGIVEAFLAEGARVAYSGTRLPDKLAGEGFVADLTHADAPARLVQAVIERFGGIDVLVNNAGVGSRASEWELLPRSGTGCTP